jgi:hypothetical protein
VKEILDFAMLDKLDKANLEETKNGIKKESTPEENSETSLDIPVMRL